MKTTQKCLIEALQGESNAIVRYADFADVALKEGFKNIAYLFKALVETERVHQKNHLRALGECEYKQELEDWPVSDTTSNLQYAVDGETLEYKSAYPSMIKQIRKEGSNEYQKVAILSMTWSSAAEKTHAQVLKIALKAIKKGMDLDVTQIFVCEVCGNLILSKELPKSVCDICGHDALFYKLVKPF